MFDIASMLGTSNSGSAGSTGFNFADYAAIKNGSYGKLVKSYYQGSAREVESQKVATAYNKTGSTNNTAKASSASEIDKTGLGQIRKDADQLKTSTEALGKEDLWKTKDNAAVANAVKDFVEGYNKVIDQASKVNSKEISRDVKFMKGMTDTFSKVLGKIGVTVGDDGKMSVDEEALKKADTATVRSLFEGNATYGSQIADKANGISRDADMNSSLYSADATASSVISSVFNQFI